MPSGFRLGNVPLLRNQERAGGHGRHQARKNSDHHGEEFHEGTLDRFPGLKILAAHGGGYLGSYAARSDHACFVSPQNCNPGITLKKQPSEYLNQLYFDAMVFTPEGLRHLVAQVGASQIVLGTDHPIPWEQHPVDHVFATTLSDQQKAVILGGNAERLFGLKGA